MERLTMVILQTFKLLPKPHEDVYVCIGGSQITVDLLGVVVKADPLGSIKRKVDGSEISRRDLTLLDQRCQHF